MAPDPYASVPYVSGPEKGTNQVTLSSGKQTEKRDWDANAYLRDKSVQ